MACGPLAGMAQAGTTGLLVAAEQASLSGITVSSGTAQICRREPAARAMPEGIQVAGPDIPISLAAYERAFEAKVRWEAGKFGDSETNPVLIFSEGQKAFAIRADRLPLK